MYREAEMSSVSVLEFAAQCVLMGENLRFSKDALRHAFAEVLGQNFKSAPAGSGNILADWQNFYRDVFSLVVDFSNVQIPDNPGDFDRVIFVAQGLTMNRVFEVCLKNFPCWRYADDLDRDIPKNDKDSKTSYARRFRDRAEADDELKNLSANDLARQGVKGITLLERLLYELKYWKETGKHLDIHNWTLCAGSRYADGHVPLVRWDGGELDVRWLHPGRSSDSLRSRAAV